MLVKLKMSNQCKFVNVQCCNPLKKTNHNVRDKKKLRNITDWICKLYPEISKNAKICDSCRKEISALNHGNASSITCQNEEKAPDSDEDPSFQAETHMVETLNTSLQELGESPIDYKKIKSKNYAARKVKNIDSAMKRKLFVSIVQDSDSEDDQKDLIDSVLQNLKTQFSNSESRNKKLMILTCIPLTWGIRKIMREFNAPDYMVRQSRRLLEEKGILESPNPKPGKSLPKEVVQRVQDFYENDEVSRAMPGMKDCVTVVDKSGNKTKTSKRLILCNLKEAYALFKDTFPCMQIGFSKFAELRPKHCVLAGSTGTHAVCVCTTHQNVKLMIENAKLGTITNNELKTYRHFMAKMLCNPPSIDCLMSECKSCPGDKEIRLTLERSFQEKLIEKITFRQWISVDRCTLETLQKPSTEFIDLICNKLTVLIRHDFIAKQQTAYMNQIKEKLTESEYAVTLDFAENYSMVVQDEAQSYHWASDQATVHPFVIYYKEEEKVKHLNYVVISDCLEHNTVAVYTFQKKLIHFLTATFGEVPRKIIYFSDGSAAQYKNKKNFINLCHHKQDFGIAAEWHFSATAHGKGPCDGVGGTVKRLAAKASLQRPLENQILTPCELYEWSVKNITGISFDFSTQEEHVLSEIFLKDRFSEAHTIKGTQQYHAFIPLASSLNKLSVKFFSDATNSFQVSVSRSIDQLKLTDCNGYMTVVYGSNWWLAYVLEKNEEEDEVKVTFLHPQGPSPSFSYPRRPDVLWIPFTNVLCVVSPTTPTGRIYVLSEDETLRSNEKLLKCFQ